MGRKNSQIGNLRGVKRNNILLPIYRDNKIRKWIFWV